MNFDNFTTRAISDNIVAQLNVSLQSSAPLFPRAFRNVLAKAIAAVFIILYKYGSFMFLQIFVRTASAQNTTVNGVTVNPLLFWGQLIGVPDPSAATFAQHEITLTNTQNLTRPLLAGLQLTDPLTGVTHVTTAGVTINAGDDTVTLTIRAASGPNATSAAGVIGNIETGGTLNIATSAAGLSSTGTVTAQLVTGVDAGDFEVYRQVVIGQFQNRPQGGAYADYQQWAEETPGVINAYPYTGNPGIVDVYVEADTVSSGSADGIPTQAQLEDVLNFINLDGNDGQANRRNANAFPNILPITRLAFTVTVSDVTAVADLVEADAQIEAALETYFLNAEPFIPGLSVPPRRDNLTRPQVSAVVEEVITALGGSFTGVTLEHPDDGLLDVYTLREGEKARLGGFSRT